MAALADDAEAIVAELAANALSHGLGASPCSASFPEAAAGAEPAASRPDKLGLRLLRRPGELMCAVLDPSDEAPVLREADYAAETGRGLQVVDALSDLWGWSPLSGSGKAVWAILFFT
jgi:hypothetical protein